MRRATAFATAFGATRSVYEVLRRRAPGDPARWQRKNYAGRTVDLYAGPAAAVGAALAASGPAAVAVVAAGACGAYDDVKGDHRRGFRAHLSALGQGEVTSGAVKLFGIGAAGLAAGRCSRSGPSTSSSPGS